MRKYSLHSLALSPSRRIGQGGWDSSTGQRLNSIQPEQTLNQPQNIWGASENNQRHVSLSDSQLTGPQPSSRTAS